MSKFRGYAAPPNQPFRSQIPWTSHVKCYHLPTSTLGYTANRVLYPTSRASTAPGTATEYTTSFGGVSPNPNPNPSNVTTAAQASFQSYEPPADRRGIHISPKRNQRPPEDKFGKRVAPHRQVSRVPLTPQPPQRGGGVGDAAPVAETPGYTLPAALLPPSNAILPCGGGRRHFHPYTTSSSSSSSASSTTTTTSSSSNSSSTAGKPPATLRQLHGAADSPQSRFGFNGIRTYATHNHSSISFEHAFKPSSAVPPTTTSSTTTANNS